MTVLFFENSLQLKAFNYFRNKALTKPLLMIPEMIPKTLKCKDIIFNIDEYYKTSF